MWKQEFKERGVNIGLQVRGSTINGKCGPHNVLCYGDGKLFAQGTCGVIYALDAAMIKAKDESLKTK